MPASTRGKKRDNQAAVFINPSLAYVFNTRDFSSEAGISNSDIKTALGHMSTAEAQARSGAILVSGANAPKPARVTKRTSSTNANLSATVSTFCAYNTLTLANAQGWRLSKRAKGVSLAAPRADRREYSGVVQLSNGLNYVQSVDAIAGTADRRSALGIQIASQISASESLKLVRGCKSKPGKVAIPLEGGVTAFLPFSTSKVEAAGSLGSILAREYLEYEQDTAA